MIERRHFIGGAAATLIATQACSTVTRPETFGGQAMRATIAAIEKDSGGRLGVAVYDTQSGARFGWRADERFAMCSTFKFLLAAAVLQRVDRGEETLTREIIVTKQDIIANSSLSEAYVGGEPATVADLCRATMIVSDNAAANLLLPSLGGPAGMTAMLRAMGDPVTRIDRYEPMMNSAIIGDPRDTTSPQAMLDSLDRIVLGTALSAPSRALITGGLVDNRTGGLRLRAALPKDWRAGDKTGTNADTTANDLAILWPPKRAPILVTSYLTESRMDMAGWGRIHARVAAAVVAGVGA